MKELKGVNFFLCWVYTLLVGFVIAMVFGPTIALITTIIAAVCSAPFIAFFAVIMNQYIKKKPTKSQLHGYVFFLHVVGSIITYFGLWYIADPRGDELFHLAMIMATYFGIDSIFFHSTIERRYNRPVEGDLSEDEPLDQLDEI